MDSHPGLHVATWVSPNLPLHVSASTDCNLSMSLTPGMPQSMLILKSLSWRRRLLLAAGFSTSPMDHTHWCRTTLVEPLLFRSDYPALLTSGFFNGIKTRVGERSPSELFRRDWQYNNGDWCRLALSYGGVYIRYQLWMILIIPSRYDGVYCCHVRSSCTGKPTQTSIDTLDSRQHGAASYFGLIDIATRHVYDGRFCFDVLVHCNLDTESLLLGNSSSSA